jgi:hypothetical protein
MGRVKGFYKKDGKTRPITKSKGKSNFHGQTTTSTWKKSSINDVKQNSSKLKERQVTIKYTDGTEKTYTTKAHSDEHAILNATKKDKDNLKKGNITSISSGGTVAPASLIEEAIEEPEGTIFGGPFGALGPQWPWIRGYKGNYFERSQAWSQDKARGRKSRGR